jgi:hypothetical protein
MMSKANFNDLEVYFSQPDTVSDNQYIASFVPNLFVIIVSTIALVITRVEVKDPLENLDYDGKSGSFKLYIFMVWLFLLLLVMSA